MKTPRLICATIVVTSLVLLAGGCARLPDTGKTLNVVPGARRENDVRAGRLFAISPGAVPRFLDRFEKVYGRMGRSAPIGAVAAAPHRLP